jgi:hypothetical protein
MCGNGSKFLSLHLEFLLLFRKGMFGLKLKKKKKNKAEKGLIFANKAAQGEMWGGMLLTATLGPSLAEDVVLCSRE